MRILTATALTFWMSVAASQPPPQHKPEAPQIEAPMQAERTGDAKGVTKSEGSPASGASASGISPLEHEPAKPQGEHGSEEGSEFWPPVYGYRVKVTDSLLVLFTFLLWLATQALLKDARSASSKDLRAYVGIETIDFVLPNIKKSKDKVWDGKGAYTFHDFLRPRIKNYGKTPASNMLCWTNWVNVPGIGVRLPDDFAFDDFDSIAVEGADIVRSRMLLNAGQEYAPLTVVTDFAPFREAESRTHTMFLYGHIDYTDIYEKTWQHDFCFVYAPSLPPPAHLTRYDQHNGEKNIP